MEAVQVLNQLKHIKNYVRLVYKSCVECVNPKLLVKKELIKKGNQLIIRGNEYTLENNCYVIGFGKAVLEMALASEEILGSHIRGGVLSVPEGIIGLKNSPLPKKIKVFEGAKGNVPDDKAFSASKSIVNLSGTLCEKDLLFVLVSGGGSALLPYPAPPLTLQEKLFVTKSLSKAGADIIELNAVRKRLSLVKGGRLTKIAYPAQIVTLVLSDVVDDSLDVIASGPTVPDKTPHTLAMEVLKKYDLVKTVPPQVIEILNKSEPEDEESYFSNAIAHVIGNNTCALQAGENFAAKDGYLSKIMTSRLRGDVKDVARSLAKLACLICQALSKTVTCKPFNDEIFKLSNELSLDSDVIEDLTKLIFEPSSKNKICLLFGGESTVKVTGSGEGGRNQEMALRFSVALDELAKSLHVVDLFNVVMLCAGTDGIDGPTDAAGAICYNGQSHHGLLQNLNANDYIKINNSYKYYSALNNGEDLLKCGLTGTNVMDINILTVQSKI